MSIQRQTISNIKNICARNGLSDILTTLNASESKKVVFSSLEASLRANPNADVIKFYHVLQMLLDHDDSDSESDSDDSESDSDDSESDSDDSGSDMDDYEYNDGIAFKCYKHNIHRSFPHLSNDAIITRWAKLTESSRQKWFRRATE